MSVYSSSKEEIISIEEGQLNTPSRPTIPFIEGDGVGADIWRAAQAMLDAAVDKAYNGEKKIQWLEVYAGQKAFDRVGKWLPEETIDAFKKYLVSIKGPLTTPVGGGMRSLNVAIRQKMDLYTCLRPIRYFNGVPSPVKHPEKVDMIIFRENTEDIYAGIEFEAGTEDNKKILDFLQKNFSERFNKIRFSDHCGIGIKPVSREGTERLVLAAIEYAIEHKRKSVTLVHKGNIMKFTEGAFRDWGYDIAEKKYPQHCYTWKQWEQTKKKHGLDTANQEQKDALDSGKILIKDAIADIALQQVLTRPTDFDVVATLNLNGDYLSDALAAQVGGIGIAPGGNINYKTGHAVFEATHGTAPKYTGLDKVNPGSVTLSGELMLRYLGWTKAADKLLEGINKSIQQKKVTYDFARLMRQEGVLGVQEIKCSEFGFEVIKNMT